MYLMPLDCGILNNSENGKIYVYFTTIGKNKGGMLICALIFAVFLLLLEMGWGQGNNLHLQFKAGREKRQRKRKQGCGIIHPGYGAAGRLRGEMTTRSSQLMGGKDS